MTHTEILKDYMWSRVDYDWKYNFQCVDWIKLYSKKRWRRITTSGNAIDFWSKWLGKDWKKIKNTTWWYPSEWDVVIWWDTWWWGYWHIAIANRFCNPMVLRTTDQNAGSGNWDWLWTNSISPFFRWYSGILGWYTYTK